MALKVGKSINYSETTVDTLSVVTLESGSSDDAIVGESGGESSKTTPQGALTVMENDGKPIGFINAEEVTAFRTALASSLLMVRRSKVRVITVFGAGKQACVFPFFYIYTREM